MIGASNEGETQVNLQPIDDPKKAGIPVFLQVQNRRPPTVAEQARIDAFFARPLSLATGSTRTETDLRVAAEIAAALKAEAEEAFKNRIARAKARTTRESRWIPGCAWNTMRSRWEHPGARWDADKQRWITKEGAPVVAAPQAASQSAPRKVARGSKTVVIAALLKRNNGCTTADVLAATGWPAVSMPAQAKLAGLVLRKEKKPGGATRYWGS